jgi:25S rRNA (uracil2634-N3)-methyltransferase
MGVEAKGNGVLVEGAPPAIAVEEVEAEEEDDEEKADAEEGSEDDDEEGERWLGCYSSAQSIPLVGEGNFSFSLALATAFGSGANLVATSLDTDGLPPSIASAFSCGS